MLFYEYYFVSLCLRSQIILPKTLGEWDTLMKEEKNAVIITTD